MPLPEKRNYDGGKGTAAYDDTGGRRTNRCYNETATNSESAEDKTEYLSAFLQLDILMRPFLTHGSLPALQRPPMITLFYKALNDILGRTGHDCVVLAQGIRMRKRPTESLAVSLDPQFIRV